MKVPGRAWLQYEVTPTDGGSRIVQTAFFEPKGLPGLAYWYGLYPVHGLIFRGTIRVLAKRAARAVEGSPGRVAPDPAGIPARGTRDADEAPGTRIGPSRPARRAGNREAP